MKALPLLFLGSVLFVMQQRIFVLEVHDQLVQLDEVVLQLPQLVKILLQLGNQNVLLLVLDLGHLVGSNCVIGVV